VTASLVVDDMGQSTSELGNSQGIGNEKDLELLLWFRSRAEIVLTSGITAEAENYKYPSRAELAILTNSKRNYPRLSESMERVTFLSNQSFAQAINSLKDMGFTKIHTEFGATGFKSLADESVSCFVSSKTQQGITEFLGHSNLLPVDNFSLSELQIARVVGRGKD